MKSFKTHTSEGTFTSGMIKSLGFMLRNKLSQKIKSGKASKDLSQKLDAVRRLLGQSSVTNTSAYLGVTDESALDLARQYNM